jgi:hypothetical protein
MIGIVTAFHERFVKQLDGSRFASVNCTMAAAASLAHRHTLGKRRFTGAKVREATGDYVGGTTLDQARSALMKLGISGLPLVQRGMRLSDFYRALRGRGSIVQGSAQATYGTRYRASFTFRGNHAWYVARGKGWDAQGRPAFVLVYDPLADGRAKGLARSPFWLPRYLFERFCYLLDFGYERLGPGHVYALMSKVTVPHRHVTVPAAVYYRAKLPVKAGYRIRRRPGGAIVRASRGETFDAWQKLSTGPLMGGSRVWYGDHSGTRWVHRSALR